MVLISPMSTMIKNVTLMIIVTYGRKNRLMLISASHSTGRKNRHVKRDIYGVSLLLTLALIRDFFATEYELRPTDYFFASPNSSRCGRSSNVALPRSSNVMTQTRSKAVPPQRWGIYPLSVLAFLALAMTARAKSGMLP